MTPNIDFAERMKIIAARMNAGVDTYAGRSDAWHKLGTVFGEFKTWMEMLKAAGADFEVVKKQLDYQGVKVPAWGIFRRDAQPVKGREQGAIRVKNGSDVVSYLTMIAQTTETYEVIQHTSGFELLDELVGVIDGAHYETMGTLDFGKTVWGQVDPNLSITVGDDETRIFLTFRTSHDSSVKFEIFETAVRQVCRNTFRAGYLKKLAASITVKHTKNAQKRINDLKAEIGEIRNIAMTMQERLNFLAKRKVTRESYTSIMDRLFPPKEDGESSTRRNNILAEIADVYAYNDGDTFKEQRGTAYNLLNAITEYTDHFRTAKNGALAESATFGTGDKLKTNALDLILSEAENMPPVQEAIKVAWKDSGLNVPGMN